MMRLPGDVAFLYCHNKKNVLESMILSHVDDFIMAEKNEFVNKITEKVNIELVKVFRLTGIYVKNVEEKIEVIVFTM